MNKPRPRSAGGSVFRKRLFAPLVLVLLSTTMIDDTHGQEWLDSALQEVLEAHNFTGNIETTLPERLGRPLDPELIDLGRLLFFDEILSLHDDNACAGCHTPAFGFGDPQSIAYGIGNNRIVGPLRGGIRNERRAPLLTNSAFFPKLMLNGRFEATSGDPFDNSEGFTFPPPNETRFQPNDPLVPTLLTAQAFLPVPSLTEMAGFQGTTGTHADDRFDQFDDGIGTPIPTPDATGNRQPGIRALVIERLNANAEYRRLFENIFGPGDIIFEWVGQALAEFQMSLLAANAPIDRFARGETEAMTPGQKRGALLFFGEARCVECHAVSGQANEMFSDFDNHVIGVPQIGPSFGVDMSNALLDGPNEDEDFGRFRITGDEQDLYAFRTSPIRNVAVQPTFFHNGAFTNLEAAIRHHLDVFSSAVNYDPATASIEEDLHHQGPLVPVLERVDPILQNPIPLTEQEFADLLEFVRDGLLDPRALPENLCQLVPEEVPSGRPLPFFEGCKQKRVTICHHAPGRLGVDQVMEVFESAVYAHLAHGDHVGFCNGG